MVLEGNEVSKDSTWMLCLYFRVKREQAVREWAHASGDRLTMLDIITSLCAFP